MKSLSVKPHWAGMILAGIKTIEIRSRRCSHRGELLICTSGRGATEPGVPHGVTLCIVDLIDSRPMTKADERESGVTFDSEASPKQWSWIIGNVRPVEHVPVKGRLSFFDVPDEKILRRRCAA